MEFLQDQLLWIVGAAGVALVPLAWKFAQKKLGDLIAKEFLRLVESAMEKGDDDDDALVLALVRWIERKTEKAASNEEKLDAAVDALVARVPRLASQRDAVEALAKQLLERLEKQAEDIGKNHPPK